MLLYDWTRDPHHTFLRICIILKAAHEKGIKEIEYERLRILDFILAKPMIIAEIRFDNQWAPIKTKIKNLKNVYNQFPKELLFEQMKSGFEITMCTLQEHGIVKSDSSQFPRYEIYFNKLSTSILEVLEKQKSIDNDVINLVGSSLIDYRLLGKDGLKHRTELMEYRYDNY